MLHSILVREGMKKQIWSHHDILQVDITSTAVTCEKCDRHTVLIICMIGNTGVDSMSSINKSGCDCSDVSCIITVLGVGDKRNLRNGSNPSPSMRPEVARLKLRKARVAFLRPRNHSLVTDGPTRRCRPSPSCSNLNQSKYTMPCTPPSRCGLFFPFLVASSHAFVRYMNAWFEV